MFKFALKIFFALLLIAIFFLFSFFYETFSNSQKIFSNNTNNFSFIRQLGEMVFTPTEKLRGENNGRINVLFLGSGGANHPGGDLTDTIMIASIKPQTNEAAILSVPRDLYVQIPGTNINSKINAVKLYGEKSKEKNGVELIKQSVKEISGLDIHYYVELNFDGFIKIIDDLGGVDVYLEKDINDPTYPNFNRGYDPFYISSGQHHLDGATALKVSRSRHSAMGDFDRIKRQQDVIRAIKQKVFEKYSQLDLIVFKNVLSSLNNNLRTDIQPKEIPRFYKIAKEIKNHKISADTIDTKRHLSRTYVGMGYTLQAKKNSYEDIKNLSENIFNIEISDKQKTAIEKEEALIEIRNGAGSPDLANEIARDLEELNFRIVNSVNINSPDFSGARIYDNSKNLKSDTLEFLKKKFNAVIISASEDNFSRADFVIVLGKGF